MLAPTELAADELKDVLKDVERKGTSEDLSNMKHFEELAEKALEILEDGQPLRCMGLAEGHGRGLRMLHMLTAKPVLYVCNVAEEDAATGNALSQEVFAKAN